MVFSDGKNASERIETVVIFSGQDLFWWRVPVGYGWMTTGKILFRPKILLNVLRNQQHLLDSNSGQLMSSYSQHLM